MSFGHPGDSRSLSVMQKELTSLRNQLAEAQREIARLNDWEETRRRMDTSDNFLCGHKSQFSYTHDGGKTCFCMECQRDQLKQQLLACELNRSKAKDFILLAEVSSSWETTLLNVRTARAVLREEPQTALTEALKPVREALKETSETLSCLGTFYRHSPIWGQIKVENKIEEAKQALSILDKQCSKGPQ